MLSRSGVLALAAVAVSSLRSAPAHAQTIDRIRVGSTANDSYAEPFYADDEGFFTRAGLNVEINRFPNGGAVTTAAAGNAIDVGITNPISLANAVEHGLPFAFFAAAGAYNPNEVALCVAADSPVKTARDLTGKTLGTTALRGSNALEVSAWIDQMGGDSTTLQFAEMPMVAMAEALRRGAVAAAEIAEPALSAALKAGGVRVIGHPLDVYGSGFMVGGWFGRTDWLAANAAVMRRFVGAVYQTARWANTHPAESAAILAKYSKIDLAVVRGMNRARYAESFEPSMFQRYLDIGYKYKYIGRQFQATSLAVNLGT